MSAGTGWDGRLELGFRRSGARTVLARRSHHGPLRLQRPLYPDGDSPCHAILLHPPGGVVGGDTLALDLALESGAEVVVTTPGATKWYRAPQAPGRQVQRLRVQAQGMLEWLPQESIFYGGTHVHAGLTVELEPGARFLGWDILQFGRPAAGDRFERGTLQLGTQISSGGQLLWTESARLAGGGVWQQAAAGMGGASVCATLWAAGADLDEALITQCREAGGAGPGQVAATLLPGLAVLRYRGDDALEAKRRLWDASVPLRRHLCGRTGARPRIWAT